MRKQIEWIQRAVGVCVKGEELSEHIKQGQFAELEREYNTFSKEERCFIKDVLLAQFEREDLIYVLSYFTNYMKVEELGKIIVEKLVNALETWCGGEDSKILDFVAFGDCYMEQSEEYRENYSEFLSEKGLQCLRNYQEPVGCHYYYYMMSFLLYATKSKSVYVELLQQCVKDTTLTKENKFFLYGQFSRFNFLEYNADGKIVDLMDDLYSNIYLAYLEDLQEECQFIPKESRNSNLVIAFTTQMLDLTHGPTKTLLDRCYILEEYLNKKVCIVNTAELVPYYGKIDCFRSVQASYIDEYNDVGSVGYRDKRFDFYQCPNMMLQVSVIRELVDRVKREKPYFIITIGSNSIASDICSRIVPTISIATVPSGRTQTRGQFQAIGRAINEEDRKWLEKHHYSEEHIIESLFTSAFKEQTHQYTREELDLPAERFIAVLVGGRLDAEIDAECLEMLERLTDAGIFIVFVGCFNKYEKVCEKNEMFQKNTKYLGFQEDVLAIDECCDVYINPKRIGGGTSAAEALYKGLPVVTFDYGDVGLGAGSQFHVSDYEKMYQQIIKYSKDKEYYNQMSMKARERAACLMDSKSEFEKIIKKAEMSAQF